MMIQLVATVIYTIALITRAEFIISWTMMQLGAMLSGIMVRPFGSS